MAEDENFRKIFVGGLHYNTNEDSLKAYYQQWGDVSGAIVMRDQNTQRSRGFGFVTFASSVYLEACLGSRPHVIDGKEVECKRAIPREGMQQPLPELHVTSKKLFVGSIKEEMTEDHLREYFSQFGSVASIDITVDRNTGKRRGFGFVTFDDYDPVDKIILMGSHHILGQAIAVKKALEREQKEIIAAGGTVRGGRGRGAAPPRGAAAGPVRGGRGGRGGGPPPPGGGGYYNGGGYGAPGGYPGAGGYGGGGDSYGGYSDGWSQGGGGGGWGGRGGGAGAWKPGGGYGSDGYGQSGGNFGSGYGGGYGGGAMKGPGYGQRAAGPYGGGFGRGGAAGGGAPGYGGGASANPQAGGYGPPGGGYGPSYGQR